MTNLSFDPAITVADQRKRQGSDRFGLLRNVFEYVNIRFSQALAPETLLTMEEYFYIMRTKVNCEINPII